MSTDKKTCHRDNTAAIRAREQLDKLSLNKDVETKIERYLNEAAFQCIEYISIEIRHAYCQLEKLYILPKSLSLENPIRAKAAACFMLHNRSLNKKLADLYNLDTEKE